MADSASHGEISAARSRPSRAELAASALQVRRMALQTVHHAGSGHVGGPLSVADILVALYFAELRVDPARPDWEDRDRLIFSKGHSAPALYSVLALRGYFAADELATFDEIGSRLQAHPDMTVLPGLDMSTGSLGQGLSVAVGLGLAARVRGASWRTYAVLGDGESQEGSVWEAAFVAARYGLDNLAAIVDWNGLQQYGWAVPGAPPGVRMNPSDEPAAKWRAFGWHVIEIDGHDFDQLLGAFDEARTVRGRPTLLLARTTKGKGVSFMEGDYTWHAKPVSDADLAAALAELA